MAVDVFFSIRPIYFRSPISGFTLLSQMIGRWLFHIIADQLCLGDSQNGKTIYFLYLKKQHTLQFCCPLFLELIEFFKLLNRCYITHLAGKIPHLIIHDFSVHLFFFLVNRYINFVIFRKCSL